MKLLAGDLFVIKQDHVWKSIDNGMTSEKELPLKNKQVMAWLILGINHKTGKYLNDV